MIPKSCLYVFAFTCDFSTRYQGKKKNRVSLQMDLLVSHLSFVLHRLTLNDAANQGGRVFQRETGREFSAQNTLVHLKHVQGGSQASAGTDWFK